VKLLFAIDLSGAYEPVLDQAIGWAERLDATLDLAFVGLYDDLYEFVSDPRVRELLAVESARIREEHRQQLEDLLLRIPQAHRGRAFQPAGPPATAITSLENDYDALVLGTHGRSGLSHLWLGSVCERVVRTSHKPIIALRIPHDAA